jgi:hypothetical protein
MAVLQERLKHKKMTNKDLESLFEDRHGTDQDKGSKLFRKDREHLKRIRLAIQNNEDCYKNFEKEELRKEIEMLREVLNTKVDE